MDVTKAVSAYIHRMITEVSGIKVLLLDQDTTPIISTSFTQSSLLSHEVYLTDRVDNASRDRMRHLNCIALLRPTPQSISALARELRQPRYKSYWLYFTNVLQKQDIELLAEADEYEVVKEIQEFFADYLPVNSDLFSLNIDTPPSRIWAEDPASWDQQGLDRHIKGLLALLLSLKKRPVIRYERMSALAKRLGEELSYHINNSQAGLFDFRRTENAPLLLILDRRNDPVTPLLTQWTYQAMVHEVLGIRNGRVSLGDADGIRSDLQEIVLSGDQDPFFSANLFDNFGDLGASIKKYVLEYQCRTASNATIDTVADMKRFVEEYPEFRKLGGNVSKHVALLGELSRRVEKDSLLEISELEQSLSSVESHASDLKAVQTMIESAKITHDAKIRLAILYALRYQKLPSNQIEKVVQDLLKAGVPESRAALVFVTLNMAGADQRQDDLFANENFFSRGRSALKGLKGVENVYTQHTPHLVQTIDNLMRGRLRGISYPFVASSLASSNATERPQDVILFIIGGATYEEARSIAFLNAQHQRGAQQGAQQVAVGGVVGTGTRFLLGGTSIHNSRSYLDMIQDAASRFDGRNAKPPSNLGSGGPALNLSIGPVQLAVGAPNGPSQDVVAGAAANLLDPEYLGEAATGARDLASDIFSRVRRGVEGTISGLQ
ncbi:probable vacuolar protein sorting protein VpsB [Melanopsichium pennsylvanicum]|uniref:Probable vacuolar protein sorting protein VpsB n=2 Tax=Melanopsichium pennsylvanicum TaxID=63383 RepID=A0AAJ5C4G2_9BASI|nr:probable vacuolar protein sorting protein VpsB [Melanopsichium pennsylvanicum 4]SNX83612.1 probable vacuolar protein sorting protein VpsB [Melanopsichium pennsylvanicum]